MNRRSFFARMLGAACLAVAERVVPAALVRPAVETVPSLAPAAGLWLIGSTGQEAFQLVLQHADGTRTVDPPGFKLHLTDGGRYASVTYETL